MFTKHDNLGEGESSRRNEGCIRPPRRMALALLGLALAGWGSSAWATHDESLVLAYEAAAPYVEKGFTVREDNWKGKAKPGQPLLFKHQLFRGNEYWFWVATSFPNSKTAIGVYDDKGNSVSLEVFSRDGQAGVRVLPKKTGTYFVRVTILSTQFKEIDWGLVYGYR